jgi:hypothetical protein
MRLWVLKRNWLLVVTFLVLVGALTLPAVVSPLAPPKLTACKDEILNTEVCQYKGWTDAYCCLNNLEFTCRNVDWWEHKNSGTDYFRIRTKDPKSVCEPTELVCSPTYGKCQ